MKQVPTHKEIYGAPGIVVAALRGGSGKTIFSVGIIAALRNLGKKIAPFKKGPDYIDAGWLALAAGRSCYNLDTFLIKPDLIQKAYHNRTKHCELTVIEGNRGLYDCIDIYGQTSTAELAKLLDLPVLLCIDGTKTTRTMAAVVGGCIQFDPKVKIAGVLLNRIAGSRHEKILTDSIETHCGIPVLGAIPKLHRQGFPERHMGLVPTPEHDWAKEAIDVIAQIVHKYVDLDAILKICNSSSTSLAATAPAPSKKEIPQNDSVLSSESNRLNVSLIEKPCIGIIRDSAFQFYYPENIEALKNAGAKIVFTSPLAEKIPPKMDALYIGGGFPETHAKELDKNLSFRKKINSMAANGFPIYAECGGLMFLGEELILDDHTYMMTGVLPLSFKFSKRPQGHGYTILKVVKKNPFYPVGSQIKGHEFHYSSVHNYRGDDIPMAFLVERGTGIWQQHDGFCYKNVLATYTHIHACGTPKWAHALVKAASKHRKNTAETS